MTMFLHDFTYIDQPAGAVSERLLADHGSWLSPLAVHAAAEGEEIRVRVGPGGRPVLGKIVTVEVGEPYRRGEVTVAPLSWHAASQVAAFPVLTADLEVAPLGPGRTQLTLRGRYDPPLGAVGEWLDGVLLHHIAEASVRSFLRQIAGALAAAA